MQLFTHRRISIPTSSRHETIKNHCKTGNPAHTAWQVSFGRPAVHKKNPETDANACAAWQQSLCRQAVSGKIQKMRTKQGLTIFHVKHDSEHIIILYIDKTRNNHNLKQRSNSPNLDFLHLAVTLASSPFTPMPSFAFPSTQPPKTSLKTHQNSQIRALFLIWFQPC